MLLKYLLLFAQKVNYLGFFVVPELVFSQFINYLMHLLFQKFQIFKKKALNY
jgi:hypothetical protein